ncbi:unnamed protein product [Miscanthus lutarioriparius]|uniref:DUF6598 domain-containing protein n=1 Tax=Miscanthus lutarioriparius TaxID=422564 RepID=A0A811QUP0_9POAL|nr:unnamed protein product [Miscanthus lutarioriparius]
MNEKVDDPDVLEMKQLSRESEEMGKVDSDAEIADQQRRLKETEGDPKGEEGREAARKGTFKGEGEVRSEMAATKIKPVKEEVKRGYEKYLEWKRRQDEKERDRDPEEITDPLAFEAKMFRKRWDKIYLEVYGGFDKNTNIPCKRFTHNLAAQGGIVCSTLQVFSVKVEEIIEGLKWPLEVFGMVALRDSIDLSRNIIFKRERHNCQILTDQFRSVPISTSLSLILPMCLFPTYAPCVLVLVVSIQSYGNRKYVTVVRLARQVVSIEAHGKLIVFVAARNGSDVYRDVKDFKPLQMSTSSKELRIGSCMLEVTVYWSRF